MVFRVYTYEANYPGIRDADLDPRRYEDINAQSPLRFTQGWSSDLADATGSSFEIGGFRTVR